MNTTPPPILVSVIGGYLGAGKTTLVNHILRNADERIAVIVNDFGDLNIDSELIESDDGDTLSLANGCICCSMVDGFVSALDTIAALEPRPERLVIEASGVADPGSVTPYAHKRGFELDGTLVVVDAEQVHKQLRNEYIGDVVEQQLLAADLLVVNKEDLVDDMSLVTAAIANVSSARQVCSTNGQLPMEVVLGIEPSTSNVDDVSTFDARDRFRTWTETSHEPLIRDDFEAHLSAFPETVVRAKGLVRFADDPDRAVIVQVVGERISMVAGDPWDGEPSRLVVIALATE